MKLHLYFARKFFYAFGTVFAVFLGLLTLLDLVEQFRRFEGDALGFATALELALLAMPETLYSILPLVVILATLTLFLGLARTSEMVVTRAAGRSAIRALVAPGIGALLLGALAVTVFNPIVAATKVQYDLRSEQLDSGGRRVLSVSEEGLWLRQGNPDGQTVIRAERANPDGTVFYDVTFIGIDPTGTPVSRIEAERAELATGEWQMRSAKVWDLVGSTNPERDAQVLDTYSLASTLTRDQIRDSFGDPSAIPIWELPAFIASLDRAGFSARLHRVWLQMQLATPVFLLAMLLIGAAFTMRHTRFGRTGVMVLSAVLLGLGVFFIRNFAQILGENGQIPVALAAWSPPVAAILLSLGLLFHLEDG